MKQVAAPIVFLAAIVALAGCAARRYTAAPIAPAAAAARFESRALADPGLRSFLEANLGRSLTPWPLQTWDLQTVALAALYFNPAMDMARARLDTARAAIVTARARPNPTIDLVPGVPSPYLLTQDVLLLIETAGKRGDRVQAAQQLDQAAQFDLAQSAWSVVMGARLALLNEVVAQRNLDLLRAEQMVRQDQVDILQQILAAGELTRVDVDLARIELSKTLVAARAAEGQLAETKAALAAAIGIPEAGLGTAALSWPDLDAPPAPESLPADQVRREAVVNRMDVRSSLAHYAAAEAALRLEIAKQYPDFDVGPGYTYEERNSFFTVGFSTVLPVLNRNAGPIAEAEGRRREAAAQFLQTQAQVIANSERALAAYRGAYNEAAEAQSLYQLQQAQLPPLQQAIRAGSEDRLSLDGVEIQLSVLALARLDALARAQRALGALEDAVQRPLAPGESLPVNFDSRLDSPALRDPAVRTNP